jgi:hypothetical protein
MRLAVQATRILPTGYRKAAAVTVQADLEIQRPNPVERCTMVAGAV